jgi:hypothetical protein
MRTASALIAIAAVTGSLVAATPSLGSAPSPRVTRIVFAATVAYGEGYKPQTQLYSIDATSQKTAQLTFANEPPASVQPSPDGRVFVFERDSSIWAMRPDGQAQRLLVRGGIEPAWAPDSHSVAYVSVAGGRPLGIRSILLNGSGGRWLVRGDVENPAWSPDGRSLAFSRGASLLVLSHRRQTTIARNVGVSRIRWSYDGRWLAFGDPASPEKSEVVRRDGRRRIELPYGTFAWSPTRLQLAYTRLGFDASSGIYVLDLATGRSRQLVQAQSTDSLAWSPAGDAVAFGVAFQTSESSATSRLATITLSGRILDLDSGGRFPLPEVIAWTASRAGMHYRAPQPLGPVVSGDELKFRTPVAELATDGNRVAYRTCLSIGAWRPGERAVVTVRRELPLCGTSNVAFYSLALADGGNQIAWGDQRGGNSQCGHLVLAPVEANAPQQVLANGGCHTTGDPRGEARVGDLLGIGPLLTFSSWLYCDDLVGSTCWQLPTAQRPLASQTIWRACGTSWPGTCTGTTNEQLRTEPGPLRPLDVDLGSSAIPTPRVVASGDNATLVLDSSAGRELLSIPVSTVAAQISDSDLVILLPGELRDYDATSGVLLHRWPLPAVSIGGFCGNVDWACGTPRLRLEDVARGLAAYVLDGKIHLLDLATGHDLTFHDGTIARFSADGLVYAYTTSGTWPGRIGLTRWDALPRP